MSSAPPLSKAAVLPRITVTLHALRNLASLLPPAAASSSSAAAPPPLASPDPKAKKKGKEEQTTDAAASLSYLLSFPTFASLTPPLPPASYPTVPATFAPVFSPLLSLTSSSPLSLPVSFSYSEDIPSIPLLASALPSASFPLSLFSFSPSAAAPQDKKKPDAKAKTAKADQTATAPAPLYPAETLTLIGSASLPLQRLLQGESSVRGWYALNAGGEDGCVEAEVELTASDALVAAEDVSRCNEFTLRVDDVRDLPAALLEDAAGGAASRPNTAGKKDDAAAASSDLVFTLLYELPLGGSERRPVWTERGQQAVRKLTEEESLEQRSVSGQWREPQQDQQPAAQTPAPDTGKSAASPTRPPTARKQPSKAAPTSSAPPKAEEESAAAAAPSAAAPVVSNCAVSFDFSSSSFLCPEAAAALSQSIESDAPFPVQLTVRRALAGGDAAVVVGVALLDLLELRMPGVCKVEGWFALTQSSSPVPAIRAGGAADDKKKGKTSAASGKKKEEGVAAGEAMMDTLDACRSSVFVSVTLSRPLVPLPVAPPDAQLTQPSSPPLTVLQALFPGPHDVGQAPSPATVSTLRASLRSLLSSLSRGGSLGEEAQWQWRRRLESVIADVVRERFSFTLGSESLSDEEDSRRRERLQSELMAELMLEVRAVAQQEEEQADKQAEQHRAGSSAVYHRVRDAVTQWGRLAQAAEAMDDLHLSRLHHERRVTAAHGWWEEQRSDEQSQAARVSALYDYAAFTMRRGELSAAEAMLRRVREMRPQHLPSTLLLSLLLLESGGLWEATELLSPLRPSSAAASPPHPLLSALLVLLFHHQQEDELKEQAIAAANAALSASSAAGDGGLFAAALSTVPQCECGWDWEQTRDVCLLGTRYALAFGMRGSAAVWLAAVAGGEAGWREEKEEKQAPAAEAAGDDTVSTAAGNSEAEGTQSAWNAETRYAALLQHSLLASSQQQHAQAVQSARLILDDLQLSSSSSLPVSVALQLHLLSRLAAVFHCAKRTEEAESLLQSYHSLLRLQSSLPVDVASVSLLTRVLLSKQRRVAALSLLSWSLAAVRSRGEQSSALCWLLLLHGEALYADGRFEAAADELSAATVLDPANCRGEGWLACCDLRIGRQHREQAESRQQQEERASRRQQQRAAAPTPFPPPHLLLPSSPPFTCPPCYPLPLPTTRPGCLTTPASCLWSPLRLCRPHPLRWRCISSSGSASSRRAAWSRPSSASPPHWALRAKAGWPLSGCGGWLQRGRDRRWRERRRRD